MDDCLPLGKLPFPLTAESIRLNAHYILDIYSVEDIFCRMEADSFNLGT